MALGDGIEDDDTAPVLSNSKFNYNNRPKQDTGFGIAYLVLLAFSVLGALISFGTANKNAAVYQSTDFQYNTPTCTVRDYRQWQKQQQATTTTVEVDDAIIEPIARAIGIVLAVWIPMSGIFGVATGLGFLYLLSRYPQQMVRMMLGATLVIAAINMIAAFASGAVGIAVITLVFCIILGATLFCSRSQLDLVARLFAISSNGLSANPNLVMTVVLVKLASFAAVVFMGLGFVSAMNTGDVRKVAGVTAGPAGATGTCVDALGNGAPCCEWVASTWSGVYGFFCWFTIGWTVLLMLELKLFLVAGTVGQWYYAPAGTTDFRGNTARSLKHALGPSFGSLAAAGLVLYLINVLKNALRRLAERNLFACLIASCLSGLLSMLEMFTKFVTVRMAITGEGFVESARGMYNLVRQNFSTTFGAWWLPSLVLNSAVFLLALSWSTIAYMITAVSFVNYGSDVAVTAGWLAWIISFAISLYLLGFLAAMFLDVVNSVFVCYALDVAERVVTHPEVHEVIKMVPGSVIVNPDGNYAFAAGMAPPPVYAPSYAYAAPVAYTPGAPAGYAPAGPPAYVPPAAVQPVLYSSVPHQGAVAAAGAPAPAGYAPVKSSSDSLV